MYIQKTGRHSLFSKMPRLTHDQRLQIVTLHLYGNHSVQQLCERFHCDRRTAQRLVAKYRQTGSVDDRRRQPRQRVSTERDDRALIRMSSRNPAFVARQLQQQWRIYHAVPASVATVKRRLCSAGLYGRIAIKKPLLTARHRRTRLQWALERRTWTVEQWRQVCFSDESPIQYVASAQRRYVRRRRGAATQLQHVRPTVHAASGKLQVWGAFTQNGIRSLVRFYGRLNAAAYQDMLREHVLPLNLPQHGLIFQQDNATCHTARTTLRFLQQNDIDVMPWPPQSPDLAPIENLWSYLQNRLDCLEIHSVNDLWESALREWRDIPQEIIDHVIESMPRRIEMVIAAKGGPIRY